MKVLGEELTEALHIVELVGVDVVIVELLEDRQICGGLFGVVDLPAPSLCDWAFAAAGRSFSEPRTRCLLRGCPVWLVTTRGTVLPTTSAISFAPRLVPAVTRAGQRGRRRGAAQLRMVSPRGNTPSIGRVTWRQDCSLGCPRWARGTATTPVLNPMNHPVGARLRLP
jgi:hypothetical protein